LMMITSQSWILDFMIGLNLPRYNPRSRVFQEPCPGKATGNKRHSRRGVKTMATAFFRKTVHFMSSNTCPYRKVGSQNQILSRGSRSLEGSPLDFSCFQP
jgi:hypothetical protein